MLPLVRQGEQKVLAMSDAVAAIIRMPDDSFLMQLRDDIDGIWYPGCWGCFGGAIEPGESAIEALRRELHEELELDVSEAIHVSRLGFDLRSAGLDYCFRDYYLISLQAGQIESLILHEGAAMQAFCFNELARLPLTPYDAFAMHLYWAGETGVLARPEPARI